VPFLGPVVLTDMVTGVSVVTTAATGKGATEIALDMITGQDCRFLEGVFRDDRDLCEEPGSPATEEDFKGLAGWIDEEPSESPLPGDIDAQPVMVADIESDTAAPEPSDENLTDDFDELRPVALASLSELPSEWIRLANAEYETQLAALGTISPASGADDFIRSKLEASEPPGVPAAGDTEADLANWAVQKLPQDEQGAAAHGLTLPPSKSKQPGSWKNLWPAVDFENPSAPQDVAERAPAGNLQAAPLPPAPAKPALGTLRPNPKKPLLQASAEPLPTI